MPGPAEIDEKFADIYAQLSVYGVYLLAVLLVLICLAWNRYGAAISTVFETKSKASHTEIQLSEGNSNGLASSELLSPTTWEDAAFVLSPDTRKLEQATKKFQ